MVKFHNYEIDVYNLNLSQVLSDNKVIELINSPFTEEFVTHLESDKKINIDNVTSDIKNLSIITRTIPIELVNKFDESKPSVISESEYLKIIESLDNLNIKGKNAIKKLTDSNLRLVVSVAKKHINRGLGILDLIQEGNIGLLKAIKKFDYRRGFKFSTYACWWIKQAVRQHVAAQSGTIKLPSYAKNTLWKMKKIRDEYEKEFGVAPSNQEVADLLKTSVATLSSLVKCAANVVNLDRPAYKGDDSSRKMHEILVDNSAENINNELDRTRLVEAIRGALNNLTPREETVLRLRFGISEPDLEELIRERKNKDANA